MNETAQHFHFKEFCNLDGGTNAEFLINSMDVMCSLKGVQTIKAKAIEAMNLLTTDSVLEVGCGHGQDAESIAQVVEHGSVTAIDTSQKMLNEAMRRSKNKNVKYVAMSADNIEFADNTFSACYADRLLVSHANYMHILDQMIKVIKPGGTICITDVDALSLTISPYNNTTRIVLEQTQQSFVNPYMGRMLLELFAEKKLQDIKIIPHILMVQSFKALEKIFQFSVILEEAVKNMKLSATEAIQWRESMEEAERQGKFLYCVTIFTAIGRKHS